MERRYYQINSPVIVDEIFDDEIIVINFDNGNYFSLRKSAITVWRGIKEKRSTASILDDLQHQYIVSDTEAKTMILDVINGFLEEGLISENSVAQEDQSDVPIHTYSEPIPFEAPLIEKFTDMNDLLLLDPVHDVDESGWPYVNASKTDG